MASVGKKFCTRYSYPDIASPHGGVSMTEQQYRDECDVDLILKRYRAGGNLPVRSGGIVGDFSDIGDFESCMRRVNDALDGFQSLPAELRARFGNDPHSYFDFVLNPENVDECVRLGLRVEKAKPVEVTPPKTDGASDATDGGAK